MVTETTPALVEARGITVRFAGSVVLDSVDLSVKRGEIVTLIGPNGSGKTTLIRTVLGLQTPSGGTIRCDPDMRIGYVPQYLHIDRTLPITVRKFLMLSRAARRDQIDPVLSEVGATDLARKNFQDLSGGEAKRVVLARALLQRPHLLVLDEPTANVDVAGQAEFYELIRTIRDRHDCGVLLVSHNLHLVMAATDEVVCINRHVCCSGKPADVSRHPEYLALFGPRVGANLAVYAHHHDHRHALSGETQDLAGAGHHHNG